MLTNEINVVAPNSQISEAKKIEILAFVNAEWNDFDTKTEMAKAIEQGYIFGPLGTSEHYSIDSLMELINIVCAEKEPIELIESTEKLETIV